MRLENGITPDYRKDDTTPPKRKLMVIAYDFPPRRTSGVYRTTSLAKHFTRLGWQPTILTVEHRPRDLEDPTLLGDLPSEVHVERVKDLNISGWEKKAEVAIHAAGGLKSDYREARQPVWDRWIRSAGHLVRSGLYFPDDTTGWIPLALPKAIELHMQRRFDLVYTTSPPRSAPVIALMLKRLLGIPWVAEFRDPWYAPPRPWRRRFERVLLRQILESADAVITTSKGLAAEFSESFGVATERMAVVNNGYNESDFLAAANVEDKILARGCFNFTHFGTVYPGFSGCFFQALKELFRESPELKTRVRVNIIGFPDEVIRREASTPDLQDVIRLHGFVDHFTAIAAMRASDCLLIFLGNRELARLAVAGKTYEYLRSGRPILALTYEGDTVGIIQESGAGWLASPDDVSGIKQALRAATYGNLRSGPTQDGQREFVERFRYDRLAEEVVKVMDSVLGYGN